MRKIHLLCAALLSAATLLSGCGQAPGLPRKAGTLPAHARPPWPRWRRTAAETDTLGSFNGWGESDSILDYVWHSGFASCEKFETVRKQYGGIPYISDHYPGFALLTF